MRDLKKRLAIEADRPIQSIGQDRFDRQRFVRALAGVIRRAADPAGSLVLALTGPWGSGKTSVKNMLLEQLRTGREAEGDVAASPAVVEFHPWQVSGTARLTEFFFDALAAQIRKENPGGRGQELGDALRKHGGRLSRVLTPVREWLTALSTSGNPDVVAHVAPIAGAAALAEAGLGAAAAGDQADAFQEKRTIAAEMEKLTRPILVVVDDLDRLPADEVFETIRLVSANADLPNSVYLLIFDREAVERSIRRAYGGRAREALEKIVQAAFEVPGLSYDELAREFESELEGLLGGSTGVSQLDARRLSDLYFKVLGTHLKNPRHLKRLMSSLGFSLVQLSTDSGLEADVIDLMSLEAMRMFEPNLHGALAGEAEALTGSFTRLLVGTNGEKKAKEECIQRLLERVPPLRRDVARGWLMLTFPPLFGGRTVVVGGPPRACQLENFWRYFAFRRDRDDVSEAEISDMLALAAQADVAEKLRLLFKTRSPVAVLRRLQHRAAGALEPSAAGRLACALIDAADDLPATVAGQLLSDPPLRAAWLAEEIWLKRAGIDRGRGDYEAAGAALREMFESTKGVVAPVIICTTHRQRLERPQGEVSALDDERLTALEVFASDRVAALAASGELLSHPQVLRLVFFWGGCQHDRTEAWVRRTVNDDRCLLRVLKVLAAMARAHDPEDSENPYRFDRRAVATLIDPEFLGKRVRQLGDLARLSKDDQMLVRAYTRWEKRWAQNQGAAEGH